LDPEFPKLIQLAKRELLERPQLADCQRVELVTTEITQAL
jgi:hypothetical protein